MALGGGKVSVMFGNAYKDWLLDHEESHGNADLCAHFFRRAHNLIVDGLYGFVATNTICQGDTRRTGLHWLINAGKDLIFNATRSMPWPGAAHVCVSIVHIAKGGFTALWKE